MRVRGLGLRLQLGGWRVTLSVVCLFVVVNSRVDLDSALKLAHCRAACIHKITFEKLSDHGCLASHDCSQCWDVCEVLQISKSVCKYPYCVGSCLEACRASEESSPLVLLTQPMEELTFTPSTLSWPPTPPSSPPTVYVVMVDHQQYLQTLDLKAPLPPFVDPLTVQVLMVDWRGFTGVFTPRPPSPLEHARDLVRHLGLQDTIGLDKALPGQNKATVPYTIGFKDLVLKPWNLKETTRIHRSNVVTVKLSWEPQTSAIASHLIYLVTWQIQGGLLRGSLFTNSTFVTLSLQPDTLYRLQVALFTLDSSNKHSEVLLVDTHRHPSKHQLLSEPARRQQWGAVVAASTAALLMAALTLVWRWQNRCFSTTYPKLTREESGTPKIYRVISPMIRLTTESVYKQPLFSSTENLLNTETR